MLAVWLSKRGRVMTTSGFCCPGHPKDSHERCRMGSCTCECHKVETELIAVSLVTPTGVLVTDEPPESDEWFAARREGITGTDLPKILGVSKYGNTLSVWLDKRGELDDDAGEAARWGQLLEDVVAREWAERHGARVERVGVLANAEHSWMRASLDRLLVHGMCPDGGFDCGLEVKTRSAFKASDWTDGVPDDVLAQTTWGLMVAGLDHMHVAALIGGQRLVSFRVDRNPALEKYLLEAAVPVWQSVIEGVPPEAHPDSEGVLLDLLDRLYAKRAGDRELDPDAGAEWLAIYADGAELEKRGKGLKTQAKTALVQMLDDGETGLIHEAPAFTYKRPAPGQAMPADQVRRLAIEQPEVFDELKAEGFITITEPGPRFALAKGAKS